jgi:hypothetical protein
MLPKEKVTAMIFLKLKRYLSIFVVGFFIAHSAVSQQFIDLRPLDYDQKELWFDEVVSTQNTELINGREYFIAFGGGTSQPFFGTLELKESQLWYDQQFYPKVNLLYDIYTDLLILRHRDKSGLFSMIRLDQSKVEGFSLNGHLFQTMKNPKSRGEFADNGYYDVLYGGKYLKLVSKHSKAETREGNKVEYKVNERYYLIQDNKWVPVSGSKTFFDVVKNKKDDVKAFIKSKNIKMRKMKENELRDIAVFCETLIADRSGK